MRKKEEEEEEEEKEKVEEAEILCGDLLTSYSVIFFTSACWNSSNSSGVLGFMRSMERPPDTA